MSLEATNARRYLFAVVATFIIATPVFGQSMSEINQPTVASLSRSAGIVLPHEIHTQAEHGITRRLSMNDAVEMALEQNLTIQVERLNPQLQDLAIATVRAAWTPTLSTTFQNNDTQRPSSTQLDGGAVSTHTSAFSNDIGISQLTKWGGNYNVSWNKLKYSRVVIPNTLQNDTKIHENFINNLVFGFFVPLHCSEDFLSVIFGIFG